ncbi:MAG: PKD domain-containing protein [Bacteroidia bacterium]|nr:PKD domain-containing protein [Bacteroidia bacterium]
MKTTLTPVSRKLHFVFPLAGILLLYSLNAVAQPGNCTAHFNHGPSQGIYSESFHAASMNIAATYDWDFGDGTSGIHPNVNHVYPGPGVYLACLTITVHDNTGAVLCTDTWCDSVHIGVPVPHCDAHFMHQGGFNSLTVGFHAANNPPGTTYAWDFGDGATGSQMNETHVYNAPGTYNVCLTVNAHDSSGTVICTDTWCDSIHAGPPAPHCDGHFMHQGNPGTLIVGFHAANNPPGTTYAWDFGDGTTGSQMNETHVYTAPGAYYVCLNVSAHDSTGAVICTDSWCDSVHTGGQSPVCNAHFGHQQDPHSLNVFFGIPSIGIGTVYSWDYGDGTAGNSTVHFYPAPGVYYACLTVTRSDTAGNVVCTDTWCDSVRVHLPAPIHPVCNARFHAFRVGNDSTMQFIAWGSAHTTFAWDFGDGTTSTDPSPVHTYNSPGSYFVCLTVTATDSTGAIICTDSRCDSVRTRFRPPHWHHPHHQHFSPLSNDETVAPGVEERTMNIIPSGKELSVMIYPNPVQDYATIVVSNTSGNALFRVTDLTGSILFSSNVTDEPISMDCSSLATGIYFYTVQDNNGILTGKMLVK